MQKVALLGKRLAPIAQGNSMRSDTIGFVPTLASQHGAVRLGWMTRSGDAQSVAANSFATNTRRKSIAQENAQSLVRIFVRRLRRRVSTAVKGSRHMTGGLSGALTVVDVQPTGRKEKVYNITVADTHEYFANGILVANCRYGCMSRPFTPPIPKVEPLRLLHDMTYDELMPVRRKNSGKWARI
jgi:hypothetical protein